MTVACLRLALATVLIPLAPAFAGASAARARVSLTASPARVTVAGSGRTTVQVTNSGSRRVDVDVGRAGFALDLRGRPKIVSRARRGGAVASWLTVHPRRLTLPAGTSASLTISTAVPRRAGPGDHNALVVLTSRPIRGARVAVRMRLGIVVVVRAPGQVSRRLELLRLRVRRVRSSRRLELLVANRGNVTEKLGRERLTMILRRGGRTVARLEPAARDLLPRTSGIVPARYAGRVRGRVIALVELSYGAGGGGGVLRRAFHIRL